MHVKNTWRAILVCGVVVVSLACGADQDQPGGPVPTAEQAGATQAPGVSGSDTPAATAQATQDTQSGGAPSPPTTASQEAQSPTASAAAPQPPSNTPAAAQEAGPVAQSAAAPTAANAPAGPEPTVGPVAEAATVLPEPTATPAPGPSPTAQTAPPQASPKLDVGTNVGDLAPEYALQLLSGDLVSSTELVSERQPVFLFFTAVW